jgi:hypothetical protein
MGMNDIEPSRGVLHFAEAMSEGPAHVIDFVHEVRRELEGATVIVNTVDVVVKRLGCSLARENVDLMTASFQRGGQFGDVDAHAADGD